MKNSSDIVDCISSILRKKRVDDFDIRLQIGFSFLQIKVMTGNVLGENKLRNIRRSVESVLGLNVRLSIKDGRTFVLEMGSDDRSFLKRNDVSRSLDYKPGLLWIGQNIDKRNFYLDISNSGHIFTYDKKNLLIQNIISFGVWNRSEIMIIGKQFNYLKYDGLSVLNYESLLNVSSIIESNASVVAIDLEDALARYNTEFKSALILLLQRGREEGLNIVLRVSDPLSVTKEQLAYCPTRIVGRTESLAASFFLLDSDEAFWLCTDTEAIVSSPAFDELVRIEQPIY